MFRKHTIDGDETVNLLKKNEKEENVCSNSASDDETNNDFEESWFNESKESDCENGISDEESYNKFTGKDGYQWRKIAKSNQRTAT